MKRWPSILFLPFLVIPLLNACPEEPTCTTIAITSVVVTLTDTDGNLLEGADVTWTLDPDPAEPCEELQGQYNCGWEAAGEILIEASATGFEDGSMTVQVEADECHVLTEQVTLALEPILAPG